MFLSKCPLVILCVLNLCLLYLCTHCIEYKCLVSGKGGEGEVNMWTVKDGGMWTGEGVRGGPGYVDCGQQGKRCRLLEEKGLVIIVTPGTSPHELVDWL